MSFPNDVKSIIFFGKSNLELYFSAIPYSFTPDSLQVPYSLSPDWVLIGHYIFKSSSSSYSKLACDIVEAPSSDCFREDRREEVFECLPEFKDGRRLVFLELLSPSESELFWTAVGALFEPRPQSITTYSLKSHLPPWNNTLKSDLVLEFSIKTRTQERY